ncbi:MAG: hypothetical protein GY913_28185 [Proteobacteria bacterium]|nr:hypothetical protein [Pseudomonadota bacterium]MCP4920791.1 hypothetical protein [Pseudomonadota bacterium]
MDVAHARALAFVEAGDLESADPWFLNALARHPGDVRILTDFAHAMASAQDAEQLIWLEGFLHERIAHVEAPDVPRVLALVAEIREARAAIPSPPPAEPEPEPDPFELVEAQVDALLERTEQAPVRARGHLLQAADGLVRQLVLLDPERALRALDAVEASAERAALAQTEARSQAAWDEFRAAHKLPKWKPSSPGRGRKGRCQARLTQVHGVRNALLGLQLVGQPREEATAMLAELDAQLKIASSAQQRQLEAWALKRIQKALDEGKEAMGVIDDEEAIGKALYETLATVEPAWLGQAANRAWSEVFELLFAKLKKVRSGEDFDDPQRKLYALKRMSAAKRKEPTEF